VPPDWTRFRVARPVSDLTRSRAFYESQLGLTVEGGFTDHDGYDGLFLALPGGGELELTTGGPEPTPGTEDDLLVLYLATAEEVAQVVADLAAEGLPRVASGNPYWDRCGATFLDPDGARVVVAALPG
jgi:catechol 2,3-dioxygenase-like lactoylglutathione lyase family enzyme